MFSMKVKKNDKVIIINDSLKDRYVSLGYQVVDEKKKEEKKTNVNVPSHDNADKEK